MAKQDLFDEQSFLIEFSDLMGNYTTDGREIRRASYQNLVQVTGNSTGLTNKLVNLPRADILNTLTPAQLSMLVPKVRIFKVLENGQRIEYPIISAPKVSDILASDMQRGNDVGLKSFDWEDTGKSIGYKGVTRKARLVLYFQSFESLFMMREDPSTKEKISFGDLVSTGYQEETNALDTAAKDANKPFPVQIEAGWATPVDQNNILFSRQQIQEISELTTVINLLVDRTGINFGENGAVTLDIDLTGRTEATMNSTTHDLFLVDESSEESSILKNTKKRYRENLSKKKQELSEVKKNLKEVDSDIDAASEKSKPEKEIKQLEKRKESLEKQSEKLDEAIDTIRRKLGITKTQTLTRAWSTLIGKIDSFSNRGNQDGRMFYVDIPKEQLEAYMKIKEITKQGNEQIAQISNTDLKKEKQKELIEARKEYRRQIFSNLTNAKIGALGDAKFSEAITNINADPNAKARKKQVTRLNDKLKSNRSIEKLGDTYRINFFFLGDLINAALSIVNDRPNVYDGCVNNVSGKTTKDNKSYKNTRLILGTVNVYNRVTGKYRSVPIADIPISLNLFQEWWLKFVVRPEVSSYSLRNFIMDCMSSLVTSAIAPEDIGIGKLPENSIPRMATIILPKSEAISQIWNKNYDKRISIDEIVKYRITKRMKKRSATKNDTDEYLFLYFDSRAPTAGLGQNVFDLNELYHIPHILVGNTTGMVKKVNFKRTQIPKRLEASILNNKFGVQSNLLLADKYDADVELFGCPIFINGTQIYIDPRSLGLGNTPAARIREKILRDSNSSKGAPNKIFAEELGIGGYYDIVQVRHSISSGKYATTLVTLNTVGLNISNYDEVKADEKENEVNTQKIDKVPTFNIATEGKFA